MIFQAIKHATVLLVVIAFQQQTMAQEGFTPLPVPKSVRVTPSAPRQIVWDGLSETEKNLAQHLLKAAVYGRDIIYFQNHRHGLLIKSVLERSLSKRHLSKTQQFLGQGFQEYLNYTAKFIDQMGPYSSANRKYALKAVNADQVRELFKRHQPRANRLAVNEAVRLMTDPTYEVISQPEDPDGTHLELVGGNFYHKGLTAAEVERAVQNGLKSNLNCRIIKNSQGEIACEVQALSNPNLNSTVKKALQKIVAELELAVPYASSEHQKKQIQYLIKYLKFGDVEDFRQMNIEWVKDGTKSKVDFMMGFVEVYQDYRSQIGSWESYVQIVDPETTRMSVSLAQNAQTFENNMPYGKYKKTFPANYSPPAMMVYYFQEISGFHSGGYNLPNFDDIRRDVGAKNIIKLNLPGFDQDPTTLKVRRELYEEFMLPAKVDGVVNEWAKSRQALVLLHEIIGHGSGTYNTDKYGAKEDPISALGPMGSALEEQRADLAALVFAADPILVQIGFYKDQEQALRVRNQMYDSYLATFMQLTSKQRSLSEAHHRGHWLLIKQLMDKGIVEKVSRDGSALTDQNMVLNVVDYERFQQASSELLAELQRIKAERDESALKELFDKDAPLDEINKPWMQAIIERGKDLKANAGFIEQPWVLKHDKIQVFGDATLEGIAPYITK